MTFPWNTRGYKLGTALVLVVCVLADLCVLHVVWLRRSIDGGQLARGYFEPSSDGPRLVTDGFGDRSADEDMALASATKLWVSPGKALLLRLEADTDILVTTSAQGRAPYLVFGALAASPASSRNSGEVQELSSARRLDGGAGRLSLETWDATVAWEKDLEMLRAVANACVKEGSPATVHVVALTDGVRVEYGECRLDLGPDAASRLVLAVLPGPAPLLLEKATAWKTHRSADLGVLRFIVPMAVVAVAVLAWGFGLWWCLLFSLMPVLALFESPTVAILAWLATIVVGVLFCCGRLVGLCRRAKGAAVGVALVVLAGVAVAFGWMRSGRTSPSREAPAAATDSGARAATVPGVLLGYSAVAGGALRGESPGLLEHLARLGRPYIDPLSRRAFSAQTFSRIETCICQELDDVPKGSVLVFFGGSNDDWFSGILLGSWSTLRIFLGRLQFLSDPQRWERSAEIFAEASRASHALLPRQEQVIGSALACARAREQRFIFFHDFLVSDLGGVLSRERREMRDARREVVLAGGGEFVDLFDELHNEAGVAWYNDVIHPSSVGHDRVAAHIVRYLAAKPTSARAR